MNLTKMRMAAAVLISSLLLPVFSMTPAAAGEALTASASASLDIPQFSDRFLIAEETNKAPVLDGKLDDPVWKKAAKLGDFVTMYFNRKANPSTEVKLAYDAANLYIGIKGERGRTNDGQAKAEWVEILLSPAAAGNDYYHIPVVVASDGEKRGIMNFDTPDEYGVKEVAGVTSKLAEGKDEWTAEVAVPIASLGAAGVKAGDEWRLNVLRVRPGLDPVSTWFPLRHSAFWYEANGDYTVAATGVTEGRLGSLFFGMLPDEAGGQGKPHNERWEPSDLKLTYKSFTQKELTFRTGDASLKPDKTTVKLALKSPSGKWTTLPDGVVTGDKKRSAIAFDHPALDEYGAYQLKVTLIREPGGKTEKGFIAFDREHVIAAGESAWQAPESASVVKVTPAPASDRVKKLLAMIPQQPGVQYAGLPEKPDLSPYNLWNWSPEKPNELTSAQGSLVYPNSQYPENKTYKAVNAKGETVEYPYYEDGQGKRYYITAHLWYMQRQYVMQETLKLADTDPLGAARLLSKFAVVYEGYAPVYDYPWLSFPTNSEAGPPYPYYGGMWSYWFYMELYKDGMGPLIDAYEKVKKTDAFAVLSAELGQNMERKLVDGVFKPSAEYMLSYPIWNTNMDYTTREGLIRLGRAIGYPDYVHAAIERMEKYTQSFFLFDGFWNEVTLSYHTQSTNGTLANMNLLKGYSDPAGYVSSRFGKRADNLDMAAWFPALDKSLKLSSLLTYPDGRYLPIQDTWAATSNKTPDLTAGSLLMPASGIARMSGGTGATQSQLYMTFEPKYGHAHYDPLNLTLYAYGQELLPDIGYTHTNYRDWTTMTMAHNTVVVDGKNMVLNDQSKHGGSIELFAPRSGPVQVMRARQENAYPGVAEYRREPWSIRFEGGADNEGYVLDLFRVAGGSRHEYTLQGDANRDAVFTTPVTTSVYGPYLLPAGTPVTEPQSELDPGSAGGQYPGYLYVRDVVQAGLSDSRYEAMLQTSEGGAGKAGLQVTGFVAEGGDGNLFLGRSPSLRSTRVNDKDTNDEAVKYTMPKLVIRREGTNLQSTFVTALEPFAAGSVPRISKVERLMPERSSAGDVAIAITYGNTTDIVLSSPNADGKPLVVGDITLDGEAGFIRLVDGNVKDMVLIGGTSLKKGDSQATGSGPSAGSVTAVRRVAEGAPYNAFVTAASVPQSMAGQYAVVTHPDGTAHGYKIMDVRRNGGTTELLTGDMDPGFAIAADGTSSMKFFPFMTWSGSHTFRIANVERK